MIPKPRRFGAFERQIFFSIVLGILPLAILAFAALLQSAQREKQRALQGALSNMTALVSAVDSELAASLSALDALAASPRLARDDFASFHGEARLLLSRRPGWLNVVVSTPDAQQVMNAYLPLDSPLPKRIDLEGVTRTAESGHAGVNNIVFSPVLETHGFSVAVPILRDNRVAYVLTAVLKPDRIQEILQGQQISSGGVAVVVDRKYQVVARTLNVEKHRGSAVSDDLTQLLSLGHVGGWDITRTLEGVPVYTIYRRSEKSGWSAVIGIPVVMLDTPIRNSYLILAALVVGSLLIGVIAAIISSRKVFMPMRALTRAAKDLGNGEPPNLVRSGMAELDQLAAALDGAYKQREALLQAERASRELEQAARVAAEQNNKRKDEFLGMLGHELRNPLSAITSASELIARWSEKPTVDAQVQQAVGTVRRQTHQLAQITNDLLDAARALTGKIRVQRAPMSLTLAIEEALETFRATSKLGLHEVVVDLERVWIEGDATRIQQVLVNLIDNAISYTPVGGRIEVRLASSDGWAVLSVKDSGIGMDAELQSRVFELFAQGPRALDRADGGLGVGLTLVRQIVELHGGDVSVISAGVDQGCEFTVRIRCIEEPLVTAPAQIASSSSQALRFAVVEDNEDVRTVLKMLLAMDGHSVVEAFDGVTGAELISNCDPDVALVDIGLPALDGFGVARRVRSRATTSQVFLVAMSGYGDEETGRAALAAGFDHFIVKPINGSQLDEVLRRRRSRSGR